MFASVKTTSFLLYLVVLLSMTSYVMASASKFLSDVETQIRLHVLQPKPGVITVNLPDVSLLRPSPVDATVAKKSFCKKQYGTDDLEFCAKKMKEDADGGDVWVAKLKKRCKEKWAITDWDACMKKISEEGRANMKPSTVETNPTNNDNVNTKTDNSRNNMASNEKDEFLRFCQNTYGTNDLRTCRTKISLVHERLRYLDPQSL